MGLFTVGVEKSWRSVLSNTKEDSNWEETKELLPHVHVYLNLVCVCMCVCGFLKTAAVTEFMFTETEVKWFQFYHSNKYW